jgi:hypothetical protein
VALNRNSVRSRPGCLGWRTGSYYCGSRVTLAEERSLTFGALLEETNSLEIGLGLSTPLKTRRSRKELYLPAKMVMLSESRPMRNRAFVCWREKPVGKPDAGNPQVRFDEGECGNGAWLKYCDTRRRKGEPTGNTNLNLNHRATSLLYPLLT